MTTLQALEQLAGFISLGQLRTMTAGCRGEEGPYFSGKLREMAERIKNTPETYGQDGLGNEAVAHLHYFRGGMDWHITEKDSNPDGQGQRQAFGLANLGYGAELGYISLPEILAAGAELDLHYTPRTLADILN